MVRRFLWLVWSCLLAVSGSAHAATDNYDYDLLGRLIRYTNSSGVTVQYDYDAVGNILRVSSSGGVVTPVISGANPTSLPQARSTGVTLLGSNLSGISTVTVTGGVTVTGLTVISSSELRFTATVPAGAPLGPVTVTATSASASATTTLNIVEPPPVFVVPAQIAPPDGSLRNLLVTLSRADATQAHTVTLTSSDSSVALPVTATGSIASGQTSITLTYRALQGGSVRLQLRSPTLEPLDVGLLLIPDFTTTSQALGVTIPSNTGPTETYYSSPLGVNMPAP